MPALPAGVPFRFARHQDAAGDHVEREQQRDEAHVVEQHRVQEGVDCRCRAEREGDRHERERRPGGGDLAVVARPDQRKQQRPGRNREQDAEERQ
jgi:hypothetical protein